MADSKQILGVCMERAENDPTPLDFAFALDPRRCFDHTAVKLKLVSGVNNCLPGHRGEPPSQFLLHILYLENLEAVRVNFRYQI